MFWDARFWGGGPSTFSGTERDWLQLDLGHKPLMHFVFINLVEYFLFLFIVQRINPNPTEILKDYVKNS